MERLTPASRGAEGVEKWPRSMAARREIPEAAATSKPRRLACHRIMQSSGILRACLYSRQLKRVISSPRAKTRHR